MLVTSLPAGFPPRTNGNAGAQQSEFARRAARIGLSIHSTSQKLAKLTQLAKRTSMFDDPAAEINDLSGGWNKRLPHRAPALTSLVRNLVTSSHVSRATCRLLSKKVLHFAGVIKQDLEAMTAAIVDLQTLSSTDYSQNKQQQNHSQVRDVAYCDLRLLGNQHKSKPGWPRSAKLRIVAGGHRQPQYTAEGDHKQLQGHTEAAHRECEGQ